MKILKMLMLKKGRNIKSIGNKFLTEIMTGYCLTEKVSTMMNS